MKKDKVGSGGQSIDRCIQSRHKLCHYALWVWEEWLEIRLGNKVLKTQLSKKVKMYYSGGQSIDRCFQSRHKVCHYALWVWEEGLEIRLGNKVLKTKLSEKVKMHYSRERRSIRLGSELDQLSLGRIQLKLS